MSSGETGGGWPQAKSLAMIPELYRTALAYGFNPLNAGHTMPTWKVRNVVRWHRPNPTVGALGDKFRPSTTDMVIATQSGTRWFDLDAVRTEAVDQRVRTMNGSRSSSADSSEVQTANYTHKVQSHPLGGPPLDTWIIPTEGFRGAHYATFPRSLLEIPIKSMCPKEVCNVCGEPRRRIVEPTSSVGVRFGRTGEPRATGALSSTDVMNMAERITAGWTDCGHDSYRTGVVLDPFVGSGTTLEVAAGLGRSGIGIDIDSRNFELALRRCLLGMFLNLEIAG